MEIFKRLDETENQILALKPTKILYFSLVLQIVLYFIIWWLIGYFFGFSKNYYIFLIWISSIFLVYLYYKILDVFLLKVLLTNKRLILIQKISVFQALPTQIFFEEITEIKALKKWFFQNTFNYGTITIFTKKTVYDKKFILNPIENSKIILENIKK